MPDKNQYNSEGQRHGYWEDYYSNGNLMYKGNYINGNEDGDFEWYNSDGSLQK